MPKNMFGVEVKVKPTLKELERRLAKARKNIADASTVNKKISILLDQWVQLNFATQGGKVGGWHPFRFPDFGRHITGVGWDPSAKLLQDTGRLKSSFIPFTNKNNAGIGSELPYSKPHEEGTARLPQRRMLPDKQLDKGLMKQVEKMLDEHVVGAFDV